MLLLLRAVQSIDLVARLPRLATPPRRPGHRRPSDPCHRCSAPLTPTATPSRSGYRGRGGSCDDRGLLVALVGELRDALENQ